MNPRIEILQEKKLVGKYLTMSLVNNKAGELWQSFIPRSKKLTNQVSNDFVSMTIYNPT